MIQTVQSPASKSESTSEKFNRGINPGGKSFSDHLKDSLAQVNESQKSADQMSTDLATGKTENIHETMLAISHAQLNFNLMVQVRNKALEAYQEVMRMPV